MTNRSNQSIFAIVFISLLVVMFSSPAWAQNSANLPGDNQKNNGIASADNPPAGQSEAAPGDEVDPSIEEILSTAGALLPVGGDVNASRYTLGPTDVINVTVMRHPEVTGLYDINNEGNIQYEFIGDIQVSGMTKDEAAKVITTRLEEFIINPEVTVKIASFNSKIAYVVGEVYNPGKIIMRGDTITVRDALVQAGLPMLSGITKKSYLITPSSEEGDIKKKRVNVYSLLYEGDLRENYVMKPGDVLYIPPTFLTKAMRAIQPVAAPVGTAAGTGRTLTTGY